MRRVVMTPRQVGRVAAELISQYRAEQPRLNKIASYMHNQAQTIYVPRSATTEYRRLVDQARFNILPLVVDGVAQNLYIEGYRSTGGSGRPASQANLPIWDAVWQPNRMDARQAALWRPTITYGYAYGRVLPGERRGERSAVITPMSPRRVTAIYDDPLNDEWPRFAMECPKPLYPDWQMWRDPLSEAPGLPDGVRIAIYDDEARYWLARHNGGWVLVGDPELHEMGVCPFVRFFDSFADEDLPTGKVEPLLPAQRQLNQTTYSLLMAQQYAAFRQRWVTGMAIPEDENGATIEPFNAAVDRVWHSESSEARFGDFQETNLSGLLESRDKTLMYISSVAQVPPHNMIVGSGISNISAEAMAALESGRRHDVFEHQESLGEGTEQLMRLSGRAMGDDEAWNDTSAQVKWRDTTPRSLAQIADALGKLAIQLEIPPRALWERIPGVTDQDIANWEAMAAEQETIDRLGSLLGDGDEQESDEEDANAEPGGAAADSAA